MSSQSGGSHTFIQTFPFQADTSKPGRVLSSAKIGNIYMSRLVIRPGVATGNCFHKDTRVMFYVEKGEVQVSFEHVRSHEKDSFTMEPDKAVVHIPPLVAHATKNVGTDDAVLVFFSDNELRSKDCYAHQLLS